MNLMTIEKLWLGFICAFSFTCGAIYSFYNTDPHHWAFVAGTAIDFIQGRSLFSEVYIQYGVGEPILFKMLSLYFPINYTSIGIYTAIFYCAFQVLLYFTIRSLTNIKIAVGITGVVFLVHPFAIYPWPDYYAGFFLLLGCALLVKAPISTGAISAGVAFTLAFLFRSTYLLSFVGAAIGYSIMALANPRVRSRNVVISLLTLFTLIIFYLGFLAVQGNLMRWFEQTIGAGGAQYGIGAQSVFNLFKHMFLPERFWLPNQLILTTLSALIYLSTYVVFVYLFRKEKSKSWEGRLDAGLVVFFALLGLVGVVQGVLIFEVFRLQNSCVSLYLILAIIVAGRYPAMFSDVSNFRLSRFCLLLYLCLMIAKLPRSSTLWPLYDGSLNEYSESKIEFFGRHRFRFDQNDYYNGLHELICDGKSFITNLTLDSSVGYICERQQPKLRLPFFLVDMLAKVDAEGLRLVRQGEFSANEIIVADSPIAPNPKLKLIKLGSVLRPYSTRYPGLGTVSAYRAEAITQN